MTTTQTAVYNIERVYTPGAFYQQHADELDEVDASAFGQPLESFRGQVEERFAKAELAQIMRAAGHIVGFGLYDILRGGHWRLAVD
jgi:hypothetical protein